MSKERNLQIFIAKLNPRVREKDLEHSFSKYGSIKHILIKSGYAFIEYDNYKDAERAVRHMDGKTLEGQRIVVEHASKLKSKSRRKKT
jgi:arginine/serine-rich splicing factor 4/5/6